MRKIYNTFSCTDVNSSYPVCVDAVLLSFRCELLLTYPVCVDAVLLSFRCELLLTVLAINHILNNCNTLCADEVNVSYWLHTFGNSLNIKTYFFIFHLRRNLHILYWGRFYKKVTLRARAISCHIYYTLAITLACDKLFLTSQSRSWAGEFTILTYFCE